MKKFLIVLVLAAVAAGAWLLLRPKPAAAAETAEKPVAQVQVAPLQTQPISELLPAFGLIEAAPSGARTITLGYDALIKRVAVTSGSPVKAGEVLMEIEPAPDALLAVESARSVARLAEQSLAQTRQRLELKLATSSDVITAEQAAEDAKLKLASINKRGEGGDGLIKATEAGVVVKLDVQPGSVVPAGTALVQLVAGGRYEAHLAIESADAGRVHAGQAVIIGPANRPEAAMVTAKVRQVGASVDPTTGAVDVRVTLPAGAEWFAGEHVQGAIELQRKMALVAPRAAVLPDDEGMLLYTLKDGKAVKHAVQLGITTDDLVEILAKDVHAGDSAVVVGNYELEDAMAVHVNAKKLKEDEVDDAKSEEPAPDEAAAPSAKAAPAPAAKPQPEKKS